MDMELKIQRLWKFVKSWYLEGMEKRAFHIQSLDRFAQGVSREESVLFVARALPTEKGVARIYRKAKGVAFGEVLTLEEKSPLRREPECPHYRSCSGCHYLHLDYKDELFFKKKSFLFELRDFLSLSDIEVLSGERFFYRNRIQLHYDKKQGKIGFINPKTKKIIKVSDCLLPEKKLSEKIKGLYRDRSWMKKALKRRGHVELYRKEQNWDKPYSQGGFTQVNEKLNEKLQHWIKKNLANEPLSFILDLFGGGGNLSMPFQFKKRAVLDLYPQKRREPFYHYDMESEDILELEGSCDLMIIDPPRRGFKQIEKWVGFYQPSSLLYISCDIGTLKRDLKKLSGYQVKKSLLVDFFPGTYHYESLIYLERVSYL